MTKLSLIGIVISVPACTIAALPSAGEFSGFRGGSDGNDISDLENASYPMDSTQFSDDGTTGQAEVGADASADIGSIFDDIPATDSDGFLVDAVADAASPDTAPDASYPIDIVPKFDSGKDQFDAQNVDMPVAKYPTCSSLQACVAAACGAGFAIGCENFCVAAAASGAQAAFAPMAACIDTACRKGKCNGSNDAGCMNNCVGGNCGLQLAACLSDGKKGTSQCDAGMTCIESCKNTDCLGNCYASMSTIAQAELDAWAACLAVSGGDPAVACPGEWLTCISAGKTGAGSCYDTELCWNGCFKLSGTQQSACFGDCYGKATASDQALFSQFLKCALGSDPGKCADPTLKCVSPVGTKDCVSQLACISDCKKVGTDANQCLFACWKQGSMAEAKKNYALAVCDDKCTKKCGGDAPCHDACLSSTCKAEQIACLG